MAYQKQSQSLKFVQKFGPQLEKAIVSTLGWNSGRVIYFQDKQLNLTYDLQVDACYPNLTDPQVFVSITYCNPDKPGHSNENKLQLKLGELMLLKARFPQAVFVLVLGGNEQTWLSYIIEAFDFFFDRTIFAGSVCKQLFNVIKKQEVEMEKNGHIILIMIGIKFGNQDHFLIRQKP